MPQVLMRKYSPKISSSPFDFVSLSGEHKSKITTSMLNPIIN